MSEPKSEVYLWLHSISNGLGLERLAVEFESRGFRKTSSLKYIKLSDLDVLFPSPHKLLMAEKRIGNFSITFTANGEPEEVT